MSTVHDAFGKRLLVSDSTGRYTRTFDPLNRTRSVVNPDGRGMTFVWDAIGNRNYMLDTVGGRTTYVYDPAVRLSELINPLDQRTTYAYNAVGWRTTVDLANGTRTSHVYDAAGRVTGTSSLKSDDSFISDLKTQYDPAGNRVAETDLWGDRTTWVYDQMAQLKAERHSGVNGYAITYTYDEVGNRLQQEDGAITHYDYDAANRLLAERTDLGRTTYTYDADGNQTTIENPSNDVTSSTWDYENQNTQVELPAGEIITYTWNNDLQDVARIDDLGTVTGRLWDQKNLLTETDELGDVQADYT